QSAHLPRRCLGVEKVATGDRALEASVCRALACHRRMPLGRRPKQTIDTACGPRAGLPARHELFRGAAVKPRKTRQSLHRIGTANAPTTAPTNAPLTTSNSRPKSMQA